MHKYLLILLLLPGACYGADWDKATYYLAMTSIYTDWKTTREASKHYYDIDSQTRRIETGMHGLFGERPSAGQISTYFITRALFLTYVNYSPRWKRYRLFANVIFATIQVRATLYNVEAGATLKIY